MREDTPDVEFAQGYMDGITMAMSNVNALILVAGRLGNFACVQA